MHHSEFINLLIEEGSLSLGYLHKRLYTMTRASLVAVQAFTKSPGR
jgi:hypothetical protein